MANPKVEVPEARASFPLGRKPEQKVTGARQEVATMEKAPDWPNQPAVQTAANLVLADAAALDAALSALSTGRNAIITLESNVLSATGTLVRDNENLETTVNVVCKGSAAAIAAWGGKVATRVSPPESTAAPIDVSAKSIAVAGAAEVKCKPDSGAFAYAFQQGADPTHPELWAPPVVVAKCTYKPTGLPAGQTYFRVAILRRAAHPADRAVPARLIVPQVALVLKMDFGQPLDVGHTVPTRHDQTHREALSLRQRLAIQRIGQQRLRPHRFLNRDAAPELLI